MQKPDLFIVGAPKCGTTAMYQYLKAHPEIYMSPKKELNYFGSDLNNDWSVKTLEEYLSYFKDYAREEWGGEASVWYLYSKRAAREIKAFNPGSKIIIMLRNPVEMIYANYYQFRYNGNEDLSTFEKALEAEVDRSKGHRIPPAAHFSKGLLYTDTARYYAQVKRYLETFEKAQVLILLYEEFKQDTSHAYRQALEFLGVDSSWRVDFKRVNQNKMYRNERLGNWLHRPPAFVKRASRWLPKKIRRKVRGKIREASVKKEERPPLDAALRQSLQQQFAPDVEQLSKLIGKDLSGWLSK